MLNDELGEKITLDTVWSAVDCLADAQLLMGRPAPPTAPAPELMRRAALAQGLNASTVKRLPLPTHASATSQVTANGEEAGKRDEQQRKEEQGGKERNDKYMERQAKQTEQNEKQREQNQKQEQGDKERMNKR